MYSAKIVNPVQRGFYADVESRPNSPPRNGKPYEQPKLGVSLHWVWVMGRKGGVFGSYEKTDFSLEHFPR